MKSGHAIAPVDVARIDRRRVLQPACNRVVPTEANKPVKKSFQRSLSSPMSINVTKTTNVSDSDSSAKTSPTTKKTMTPPVSPKPKPVKRVNDPYSPNSSTEKPNMPKPTVRLAPVIRKKSKNSSGPTLQQSLSFNSYSYESLLVDKAPGSIAAAQREQASLMQAQRKMKIAHYGRTPEKLEKVAPTDTSDSTAASQEEKRCSFITENSGTILLFV